MSAPAPEPARSASLRVAFAPDYSGAREASVAIRNFLAEQGVADSELFGYELCVAEAGNNAVEQSRGFSSRKGSPVAEAVVTPSTIELRVTGNSPGGVLPDPIGLPSPKSERGRGLFLIQSVMDEMRCEREQDKNVLIMLKRRFGAMDWKAGRPAGGKSA